MDSLELKVPEEDLDAHLCQVRHISKRDKEKPQGQAKVNKADKKQQRLSASAKELQSIKRRNAK